MTHADEARRLLRRDSDFDSLDAAELSAGLASIAHATLELAEQQRIANLIALGVLGEHAILKEQVSEDAAESLVEFKEHDAGGYFQLNPEIAAALKIREQP